MGGQRETISCVSSLPDAAVDLLRHEVMGRTTLRDLPWRRTRDPWAVLVAELMLQQTQVARVVPRWHEFLERFPDAASCADARVGDVVTAWAGLGYNRRAVHLHACAVAVRERHGGSLPAELDALLALPGIGPYTARAVLAFAYEHDVAVLDTNVARVLARVAGARLRPAAAQALADSLVPEGAGWHWNQALIDFGARSCTRRDPRCGTCEFSSRCGWKGQGDDPAVGSAGVSGGQSRFAGSDREGRGRLVAALRRGPVAQTNLARAMGWEDDAERAARVAATLVVDGLAIRVDDRYELP
jgi:A/G-specific adenine glycosylase